MYQNAEVIQQTRNLLHKTEVGGYGSADICNLAMEGLKWLWEYIKLITLDIAIKIASSRATEILDNTL